MAVPPSQTFRALPDKLGKNQDHQIKNGHQNVYNWVLGSEKNVYQKQRPLCFHSFTSRPGIHEFFFEMAAKKIWNGCQKN